MKERYDELDLMKGIAIILVFLYHCFQLKTENVMSINLITKLIATNAIDFLMPLFFIISGFLSNTKKEYTFKNYYMGKIKRLSVPYLFINFIDYIPRTLFPNLVNSSFIGIKGILIYGTKITWFLYALLIIFIIFPWIDKFILRKKESNGYFVVFLLILLNFFEIGKYQKIFAIDNVIYYSIYFYIGYITRPFYKEKIFNGIYTSKKIFLIISIVFLGLFYKFVFINLFTRIFFTLMAFLFYLNICKRLKPNTNIYKFIKFCGINSLIFYLLDGFVAVVYRNILWKLMPNENIFIIIIIFFLLKLFTISFGVKFIILKSKILCFLFGTKIG